MHRRFRRRLHTHFDMVLVVLSMIAMVAVAAASLTACARTPVEAGASLAAFTRHVEAVVATSMRRYDVPGVAVALVRDGEVAWTGAYGFADLERAEPMTVDAEFHTGSISKSVTAWAVMRRVEQGAI